MDDEKCACACIDRYMLRQQNGMRIPNACIFDSRFFTLSLSLFFCRFCEQYGFCFEHLQIRKLPDYRMTCFCFVDKNWTSKRERFMLSIAKKMREREHELLLCAWNFLDYVIILHQLKRWFFILFTHAYCRAEEYWILLRCAARAADELSIGGGKKQLAI